ncbi:MAG: ABC transporter permease subunit, partial [Lentisphaeria bacterium]|nr:ABC transporter permease subunit [Lentisphaeria bacterium]
MLIIYKLARNTFIECIREPIYFLMLASALIMIGLFPTAAMFVFREQIKLVVDSSMATTLVFSLVVAVVCAAHTISREMKNGTVLLLMSKPVTRGSFVLGKILG